MTNYKKRVVHDYLVPREQYQDLYLTMRERHKHLVDTWQEVTDPLKHVFEVCKSFHFISPQFSQRSKQDIGIATFLILLWKQKFTSSNTSTSEENPAEPWRSWPRPAGGFLDFGYVSYRFPSCTNFHFFQGVETDS
jgi:tRNASer (uridine44-2'-O)-methyltransferase